ncbi:MAG TPA: DUF1080 domain-containing protein [Gemmatimonadales bacterium]|nr:DUF1080 domain-containing protein [Gemmatimonadales bacterium]
MKHLIPVIALIFPIGVLTAQDPAEWKIHSMERPLPPVVHPGGAALIAPPADAVVLFDGRTLEGWQSSSDSSAAPWRMVDGAMEVVPGAGGIETRARFGDVQLHIEWMSPATPEGNGQNRGNSGVFLMGRYEVQVLDSWENLTYADGQAAAVYGQYPPLVNASLPPGTWQSYDIIFRRPRFDVAGKVTQPARITVFHNGVLVQQNVALLGPTSHRVRAPYEAHDDRLPLSLQDHGQPVRFRNIWIRPLGERP